MTKKTQKIKSNCYGKITRDKKGSCWMWRNYELKQIKSLLGANVAQATQSKLNKRKLIIVLE